MLTYMFLYHTGNYISINYIIMYVDEHNCHNHFFSTVSYIGRLQLFTVINNAVGTSLSIETSRISDYFLRINSSK